MNQQVHAENQEINWQLGETMVYGTVVRPSGPGPFPAVVMVAAARLIAIGIRRSFPDRMAAHACLQRR